MYLDSSALVKLVVVEPESMELTKFVGGAQLVSSALARTETLRSAARHDIASINRARSLMAGVALVSIGDSLLDAAAVLPPIGLRSLDAIHVATALELSDELECLVSYDARMLEAAALAGIPIASPGSDLAV